jgi:hypothetical protein
MMHYSIAALQHCDSRLREVHHSSQDLEISYEGVVDAIESSKGYGNHALELTLHVNYS